MDSQAVEVISILPEDVTFQPIAGDGFHGQDELVAPLFDRHANLHPLARSILPAHITLAGRVAGIFHQGILQRHIKF